MLGSPSHGYLSINPIIFPLSKLITLWSQPTDIFNIFQDWRLCLVPPITNLTQHFDWHLISSQNSQEKETIINFQLWFMQSAWLGGPSSINWAITYLPWQGLSHRKCCLVLGLSTGKETRIHSSSLQLWYCWVSVGSLTGRLYLCNLLKIAEIDLLKYIKATREIYFVITTKNCK